MLVNIPLEITIDETEIIKENGLENKKLAEIIEKIAFEKVPSLDEQISNEIKNNQQEIIKYLKMQLALKIGEKILNEFKNS